MFVDDGSTGGTRDAVAAIGRGDSRVRLLCRTGRRGLASAFIEGVQCSLSPYVAAMDGDLQHEETLLPRMLALLRPGGVDIVVGSRYMPGGDLNIGNGGAWNVRLLPGLLVFSAVCSLGAAMNLVWNDAVGSTLTWPRQTMN